MQTTESYDKHPTIKMYNGKQIHTSVFHKTKFRECELEAVIFYYETGIAFIFASWLFTFQMCPPIMDKPHIRILNTGDTTIWTKASY